MKKGQIGLDVATKVFVVIAVLAVIGVAILISMSSLRQIDDEVEANLTSLLIREMNGTVTNLTRTPVSAQTAISQNNSWITCDGITSNLTLRRTADLGFPEINVSFNYTVSVWFNWTNATEPGMIFNSNSGDNEDRSLLQMKGDRLTGGFWDGSYTSVASNSTIKPSLWYHGAYTTNGTHDVDLYLNGSRHQGSVTPASGGGKGTQFCSQMRDGGADFNGSIDEIRIYNRTLTVDEILQIYNSGREANSSLPTNGLVKWLPLNENSGTTAHAINYTVEYNPETFTDAVEGTAGWDNDGLTQTLVANTDYIQEGDNFTITNADFSYRETNFSYNYNAILNDLEELTESVSEGIVGWFDNTTTIIALIVGLILISAVAVMLIVIKPFSGRP